MNDDPILTDYLRRLRWSLASMPIDERDDILAEARSHLQDKIDRGTSIENAVAGFGLPEDYAHEFINERQLASALSTRNSMCLLAALGQRSARSARTMVASAGAATVWIVTILICGVAAAKIFDPVHVGLWLGHDLFFLGTLSDPTRGHEALGPWIFPIAVIALLTARLTSQRLSFWALRPITSIEQGGLKKASSFPKIGRATK